MCGHLGGSVLGSSGLHPLPTQVCLFASCITVLFLWGHSLTLHNTLPMGPRVANKGTLVSLAHFLIYAHQRPNCKGSPRENRRHR